MIENETYKSIVTVVGGAGHVGLPLSIFIANSEKYMVNIWDTNVDLVNRLRDHSDYPYYEDDDGETVSRCSFHIDNENIKFNDPYLLKNTDILIITIGTPINETLDIPSIDSILNCLYKTTASIHKDKQSAQPLIILRSTLFPGATDRVQSFLKDIGYDPNRLVFAPERIAQNTGLKEFTELPQIIGTYSKNVEEEVKAFFYSIGNLRVLNMTPKEAEYSKLITNVYRYVNFALANEFYKLAEEDHVDIHKVINFANRGYPRMNMPQPGPNVGGPCLFKDGKFLTHNENGASLALAAHWINQSMPNYIVKKINENFHPDFDDIDRFRQVMILGETFKAESDDTRNSLTEKLRVLLENEGYYVRVCDPMISNNYPLEDYDVYVVMTPHNEFNKQKIWERFPKGALVIDIWKHLYGSDMYKTGIYRNKVSPHEY